MVCVRESTKAYLSSKLSLFNPILPGLWKDVFRFSPNARGPPKIFDVNFFQFFEKQTPKLAFWDLANMERNKVRKFG